LSGPIAPRILEPPKLDTTSLAANAPAPILTIWSLLVLNALLSVDNPPLMSPFKNDCDAVPAFAASRNARPAPVSIKLTEKDRFLRELLLALRLATMFVLVGVLPTGTPRYSLLSNYLNLVSQLPHLVGSMCSRFFLR